MTGPTEHKFAQHACIWRWLVCKLLIGCRAFQLKACYLSLISVCFLETTRFPLPFRSPVQHLSFFFLFLDSPELRRVVWVCFSGLLSETATNLMIFISCMSPRGQRKAFTAVVGRTVLGFQGGVSKTYRKERRQ